MTNRLHQVSGNAKPLALAAAISLNATVAHADGSTDELLQAARANFDVISAPAPEELDKPLVRLGQHLFWDQRLSANGKVACGSCHAAGDWGADSERFSLDAKGRLTKRNSQTVFNSMLQPNLRWTGDRDSGAHQAKNSLTGSMGFESADDVVELLEKHGYEPRFEASFPSVDDPMNPDNYAKAIEAYESTLNTPASFDRFLKGDTDALDEEQQSGLRLFLSVGCADCHSGRLLGGERLERFGIHEDYWVATGSQGQDAGLFESSGEEEDKYRFRISMLRNIEKTGPYFHDGSVAKLDDAVRVMAKVQLGQDLDHKQTRSIVAFLRSLTGDIPQNYTSPHGEDDLSNLP